MRDRFNFKVVFRHKLNKNIEIKEFNLVEELKKENNCISFFISLIWKDYEIVAILQCTTLADKNNKLIYEGDCLDVMHNVVEYMSGEYVVAGDRLLSSMNKFTKIVGNIYKNPEFSGVQNGMNLDLAVGSINFNDFTESQLATIIENAIVAINKKKADSYLEGVIQRHQKEELSETLREFMEVCDE